MEMLSKELKTTRAKLGDKKKYYIEKLDEIDTWSMAESGISTSVPGRYYKTKVNFDLYAGEVDSEMVVKSCNYSVDLGEIPATMLHFDIFSSKIKILEGLELKRPFPYQLFSVNPTATHQKKQAQFELFQAYLNSQLRLGMIDMEISKRVGEDADPEQIEAVKQEIVKEIEEGTLKPKDIDKYMSRDFKTKEEMQGNQILNFLRYHRRLPLVFNKGFRFGMLSSYEVYWVGVQGSDPIAIPIHPNYFVVEMSQDSDFIEDGQRAAAHFVMTTDSILRAYGPWMSETDKIKLMNFVDGGSGFQDSRDYVFRWDNWEDDISPLHLAGTKNYCRVVHGAWKTLRNVTEVTFQDQDTGEIKTEIMDGAYKLDTDKGDISIKRMRIPDTHEGVKVCLAGDNLYINLGPSKYQPRSSSNPYEAKLPFYGCRYDLDGNRSTCPGDRLRNYSMYYDILMWRIDKKIASNRGSKLAVDYRAIPNDYSPEEWIYHINVDDIIYMEPKQEGNRNSTAYEMSNLVKEVDLSGRNSDLEYMQIWADKIARLAGEAVGITPEMEGQIEERQAVQNVQQLITNVSRILEPMYRLHDQVKINVLNALLHTARILYQEQDGRDLHYILDDGTHAAMTIDAELLSISDYALFIPDVTELAEMEAMMDTWVQHSISAGSIAPSAAMKVQRVKSLIEKEEALKEGENEMSERAMAKDRQIKEMEKELELIREKHAAANHKREIDLLDREWKHRKENDWMKQAIMAAGFPAGQTDANSDGTPDILELAKLAIDRQKLQLAQIKQQDDSRLKSRDLDIKEKKIAADKKKAAASGKT